MPKKTKAKKVTDKSKPWNKRQTKASRYTLGKFSGQKSYLIICEGQNIEPQYFKSFPDGNVSVEAYGLGRTKTSLVSYVIEMHQADLQSGDQEI